MHFVVSIRYAYRCASQSYRSAGCCSSAASDVPDRNTSAPPPIRIAPWMNSRRVERVSSMMSSLELGGVGVVAADADLALELVRALLLDVLLEDDLREPL